jgi:hypothetical protein
MEIIRLDSAIRLRGSGEEATRDRQLALALATSMVPRLRRWAEAKTRLDAEIWALESKLEEWRSPLVAGTRGSGEAATIEEERATLEEQLLRLRSELRNIERRPWRHLRGVWLFFWGNAWRAEREAARRRLDEHETRLKELSSRLHREVEGLSQALDTLRQRRRDLEQIPRVVEGVRGLDYVFVPRRVRRGNGTDRPAGGWILGDPFGDPLAIEAPRVAMSAQELEELRDRLAGLDLSVVLLEAGEHELASTSARPPVGAERDLVDATADLSKFACRSSPRRPPGSACPFRSCHRARTWQATSSTGSPTSMTPVSPLPPPTWTVSHGTDSPRSANLLTRWVRSFARTSMRHSSSTPRSRLRQTAYLKWSGTLRRSEPEARTPSPTAFDAPGRMPSWFAITGSARNATPSHRQTRQRTRQGRAGGPA